MYVLDLRKAIIDALGLQLANPRTAKVYFEAPGSGGSSREQACLRGSELVGAAFRERSGGEWRDAYSVVLRGGDPVPVEVVLEGPPGMLLLEAAQDAASPLLSVAAAQQGMTTRAAARALLAIADTSSEGAAEDGDTNAPPKVGDEERGPAMAAATPGAIVSYVEPSGPWAWDQPFVEWGPGMLSEREYEAFWRMQYGSGAMSWRDRFREALRFGFWLHTTFRLPLPAEAARWRETWWGVQFTSLKDEYFTWAAALKARPKADEEAESERLKDKVFPVLDGVLRVRSHVFSREVPAKGRIPARDTKGRHYEILPRGARVFGVDYSGINPDLLDGGRYHHHHQRQPRPLLLQHYAHSGGNGRGVTGASGIMAMGNGGGGHLAELEEGTSGSAVAPADGANSSAACHNGGNGNSSSPMEQNGDNAE
eukprot:SM000423S15726  [mRNA]  locus=s423:4873:7541:- [translate_table: standard]